MEAQAAAMSTAESPAAGSPSERAFAARQAIERLRSGLFDPLAVRRLTAGEDRLFAAAKPGLEGDAPHLCVCGAYGQGKSHTLRWLMDQALQRGLAVSLVSLDPRELPFHDLRAVYRALLGSLQFPGGGTLVSRWQAFARAQPGPPEDLVPAQVPRLFRLVLGGLARDTLPLDAQQRRQKQHRAYSPRLFAIDLRRALEGHPLPLPRVRLALRYRQVPGYKGGSLAWRGPEQALQAIRGMARLFRAMGLGGWVILFDEAESIGQARPSSRRRSWDLLRDLLLPPEPTPGLLPVFAFTEDLLWKMEEETDILRSDLALLRLADLSAPEWRILAERLASLHGQAYGWQPSPAPLPALQQRLQAMGSQETRLKLKALVEELDLLEQAGHG